MMTIVTSGSFEGYRSEYGELRPAPDQDGNHILALPREFHYVTFSKIGDMMSDGNICPRAHDGMTCLEGRGSTVRLIRNHEVRTSPVRSTIRARFRWAVPRTSTTTRSA